MEQARRHRGETHHRLPRRRQVSLVIAEEVYNRIKNEVCMLGPSFSRAAMALMLAGLDSGRVVEYIKIMARYDSGEPLDDLLRALRSETLLKESNREIGDGSQP